MKSAVGEASAVGGRVGRIVSTVAVEIGVGGMLVGAGVDVDWIAETSGVVQAAKRNKETMINFFMINIICHCEEGALPDDTCAALPAR